MSYGNVLSANKICCVGCKEEIPIYLLKNDIQSDDMKREAKLALNEHSKKVKGETILINDIARSKSVLYINFKNENYYNCRCLQHHQSLILSDKEIENYTHTKCNSKYELFVAQELFDDLAFVRKKETKDE